MLFCSTLFCLLALQQLITDLCMVLNRMCIGQQTTLALLIFDHKAAAGGAELALALPGQGVVGFSVYAIHLHHSIKKFALQCKAVSGGYW